MKHARPPDTSGEGYADGKGAGGAGAGREPGPGTTEPPYSLITFQDYVERFRPAYPYTFGGAFQSLADQLEIRVYKTDDNNRVHFPGDLTIDNAHGFCMVVPGDLIVDGNIRMMKDHGPAFLHVTGNLTAKNLFLKKQGFTCIEGDARIGTGILVTNTGAEINAPSSAHNTGSTLIVQGKAVANVIIKSNTAVLFYGSAEAYAAGDYGFCELHASPDRFHYMVPFHELIFSGAAGLPAPSGLFDEDGIIAESAERYLLANRKILSSLVPADTTTKPVLPLHNAALQYDEIEAFLQKHGQVAPGQHRKQADDLMKKNDFSGIMANCERWVAETNDPFFYLVVVDACQKKMDLTTGVAWARRCLERFGSHNWMFRFLLSTDLALGRTEEAWQDWCRFRQGLLWDKPENDNILQLAIAAAITTGRSEKAHTELAGKFRTFTSDSPNFWFNAACLGSRAGNLNDAVYFAWQSLRLGKPRADFDSEPDFDPVKDEPAFQAVLALGATSPSRRAALVRGSHTREITIDATTVTVQDDRSTRTLEHDNPAEALTAFFHLVAEAKAQGYHTQKPSGASPVSPD
ncbi:MAG: hypothetical protein GYA23_11790 [Methanomicrobiales archaeon]|nr:hypothetical protein [Methanomicrobiales archaeon]